MQILQKQRLDFEDILAKRLLEQEQALQRQMQGVVDQKDAEVQNLLESALQAQAKEHEEDKAAFEEKQASKAASTAAAGVVAAEGLNGDSEEAIIDMESSLDDLLGGSDDLTDDIFS